MNEAMDERKKGKKDERKKASKKETGTACPFAASC